MLDLKKYTILIILAVALSLRLFALQAVPLIEDEKDDIVRIAQTISFNPTQFNFPLGSSLIKHPLLCSYLTKAGIDFLGYNKWGIRLPFVVSNVVGLFFVYLLTKEGFGVQKAQLALILLSLSQYHIGISRTATTQSLALFFVPIILYVFYKLLSTRKRQWIFLLAVLLGCGYLAKTTVFLFIPIFLIFFAFSTKHRCWLREKTLYLGGIVTFLIISPSLYWNLNNNLANLKDSLEDIGGLGVSLRSFALYLGELSPFLWDRSTINRVCSTEYPFMHWVMGLVALIGIIYSFKQKDSDLVKLLLITFCFVFGISSFVKGRPPGNLFLDSFWWVQISIIPTIILASSMLIDLKERYSWIKYLIGGLIIYFIFNSWHFINISENYFVPEYQFLGDFFGFFK